jgi:predicted TIM-barrel fold metal-dependent hydrolase
LAFYAYLNALLTVSKLPEVYMKLSGVFNEFYPSFTPATPQELLLALDMHLKSVLPMFKDRVMFGSDWPVCNVGGPLGEQNWGLWREVVEQRLESDGFSDEEKEGVWWKTGCEAYGIKM